ncbi:MAG TPA: NUDIX domain-containing protein [Chloroflexota bacterium]|nr:NUDIX domain-containing protein [Chloroflexota bacterium]
MDSLSQPIAAIDRAIGQPHPGRLPLDLFLLVSRLIPLFTVDLWIQNEDGSVLLTWREDEFFGRGWHVPGSALRLGETTQHRLHECAREELGAEIEAEPLPFDLMEEIQPHIHDGTDPKARDRAHNVSAAYRCRLLAPPDPARAYTRESGQYPQPGQWAWHPRCPDELLAVHRCYEKHFPAKRLPA